MKQKISFKSVETEEIYWKKLLEKLVAKKNYF